MRFKVPLLRCPVPGLVILTMMMVAGCNGAALEGDACHVDGDCDPGKVCHVSTGACLPVVKQAPDLEVWPPNNNNQGWVPQEFVKPLTNADGLLDLRLQASISLQGKVYASDDLGKGIAARVIAWRDSLVFGRPSVQVEVSTAEGSGDPGSFLLWLSKGFTYTFFVVPKSGKYPPLVVSKLKLDDHTKRDFVLEGDDRAVAVQGKVLDATGNPFKRDTVKNATNGYFTSSVRVRAFEKNGLNQSTIAVTKPGTDKQSGTGEFSFLVPASYKVPATGTLYTLRVETAPGGIPIPTVECKNMVLGIFTSTKPKPVSKPVQTVGDLRLPAFLWPKYFTFKVRGKDGSLNGAAVSGATVKFSTKLDKMPRSEGFDNCTASYEQTGITDSKGDVTVPLLPGSTGKNMAYMVTVVSPADSPYASRLIAKQEVGSGGGVTETIFLEQRYKLSGKVVDHQDDPVPHATIEAQGIQLASSPANVPLGQTTANADAQGIFSLYVETGTYNFTVRPPQGAGLPSFNVRNKSVQSDLNSLVFKLPAAEVLTGTVRSAGGDLLSGIKVEAYELINETAQTQRACLQTSDISNSSGRFLLVLPAKDH